MRWGNFWGSLPDGVGAEDGLDRIVADKAAAAQYVAGGNADRAGVVDGLGGGGGLGQQDGRAAKAPTAVRPQPARSP